MSNGDPPKSDVSKLPRDPVVKAAEQAIAGMFTAAVEAMSKDAENLLARNGAATPPPAKGVKALTDEMIALLGAKLRAMFPKAGSGKDAAPGGTEKP
jgi:hypothetical protein